MYYGTEMWQTDFMLFQALLRKSESFERESELKLFSYSKTSHCNAYVGSWTNRPYITTILIDDTLFCLQGTV